MNNLDPYNFYFELPLYSTIKIEQSNREDLSFLMKFSDTIDAYNPKLKENTTYSVTPCKQENWTWYSQSGKMNYSTLTCVRTKEIIYVFVYYDKKNEIFQKIGQYPSIANSHISQVKEYDKVLSKEKLKEFTRAIGLAANGIGIGSFIYLRRIFESLIEEAHIEAKKEDDWNENDFQKSRMAEKIQLLEKFLPEFLVENKSLYSILSVGVHNLKEKDCLAYFETVKVGIELILDEKVEKFQKVKKIEDAKKRIGSLTNKIRSEQ